MKLQPPVSGGDITPYYPLACSTPCLPRRSEEYLEHKVALSIIIVNWNTKEALKKCLESIYISGFDSFEVIVADNASEDGSILMLGEDFPQVRLIDNARNTGFAKANNQGVFLSRGEYILLLNSDAWVQEQALKKMVGFMGDHTEAGAMGPRLVLPDGRPQAYSFGSDPTLGHLFERGFRLLLRKGYLHDWETERVQEVDWVSGASLMVRRKALLETGLLDENFFLYFDDNDLCLRLRQKGWKVYLNPTMQVVHLGGESLVKNELARGTKFYLVQHYERWSGAAAVVDGSYRLPLHKIVIASWLRDLIELRFGQRVLDLITNGIDFSLFYPEKPLSRKRGHVLMQYSPLEWKGIADGLQAWKVVQHHCPEARLVMFGLERGKGVPAEVEFHIDPPQESLRGLYSSCDVFLSTSWTEGCQLPPMEAMACGCAVVATKVGAIPDYTIPGQTALVVEPRDVDGMAQAIIWLLQNNDERQRIAQAGYHHIQQFTWDRAATRFEAAVKRGVSNGEPGFRHSPQLQWS